MILNIKRLVKIKFLKKWALLYDYIIISDLLGAVYNLINLVGKIWNIYHTDHNDKKGLCKSYLNPM